MYQKSKVFDYEISCMAHNTIKGFAEFTASRLPDYFFEVPASSTGKYHPAYALGAGGLVRHTKAAILIARELFNLKQFEFTSLEQDCIIAALMFHDGWKHGTTKSKYTIFSHPLVAAAELKKIFFEYSQSETEVADQTCIEVITSAVASHMGQWNTSKKESVTLPLPITKIEKFVHECDYLASRKSILINFETPYNPADYMFVSDLKPAIEDFISLCKKLISNGADRDLIYQVIEKHNHGIKNPNKIQSMDTLDKIKQEVHQLAI